MLHFAYSSDRSRIQLAMEAFKIALTCILAAVLYGIVHDQVTARVCLEYFTVFHPPVFPTSSPTLLGLGWGIIATWWVGLPLGGLLALAARAGSPGPKLVAKDLVRPVVCLMLAVATAALLAGARAALVAGGCGWWLATRGSVAMPGWLAEKIPASRHARFIGDWWAHNASYGFGALGGAGLSVVTWRRRRMDHERA